MTGDQAFQRAYGSARKYIEDSLIGLGALKGAPCTIKTIEKILDVDGKVIANKITFEWTATDGTIKTDTITVKNGTDGTATVVEVEQMTLSNTWSVQHNLDTEWYNLSITCLTPENDILIGQIDTDSSTNNLLVIKFEQPFKGKAIIKK